MSSAPGDLGGRSLLAVFAHPDDESLACGGLLAWCAHLGAQVSLLCATHGEHGLGSQVHGEALGDIRAGELEAAALVLGVTELVLLDYTDGMLPWVDAVALEADIGHTIRRIRPDVVITFGQDGLYWHPDHIAIHERTTAAVAALGDEAPALYYVTMPPGSMRAVVDHAGVSRLVLGIADADAFGALAAAPTLVVDAARFAARKLTAIQCHRTQLAEDALNLITEGDAARLLGTEHFHRAEVGSGGNPFIERFAAQPVHSNDV
jgi:LmbE family N-acetylglucosaminyl deacetylase